MRTKKKLQIRVVVAEPGKDPRVVMIEDTLEALQALVGGMIEAVRDRPLNAIGAHLYVNEEGLLQGLAPNRYTVGGGVLVGPIVVSKVDHAGEEIGLTEEEARKAVTLVKWMPAAR